MFCNCLEPVIVVLKIKNSLILHVLRVLIRLPFNLKKKLQCHNFNIPERILIAGKRDTLILRLCRENVQYSVAKNYSLDYNFKKGQFKLLLQPNSDNAY